VKFSRLITRSLRFYWRSGIVVALGVAVATAVITGSLMVGASVTGSVRETALARLGNIDYALSAPAFFRIELASDLAAGNELRGRMQRIVSATATTGSAHNPASDETVPGINVFGVGDDFWQLFPGEQRRPARREVAVSRALAEDLGVNPEDYILVNAKRFGTAPTGTLFEHRGREDVLGVMRLKVVAVLPDLGVGGFSLANQTSLPRNAFIDAEWLGRELARQGRANMLLARSAAGGDQDDEQLQSALAAACAPADYGLRLVANHEQGYLSVQSETLVLTDTYVDAIRRTARDLGARCAATSVYLAHSIRKIGGGSIRYAVIAGLEQSLPVVPGGSPEIGDNGILLNTWAAADLGLKVGDEIDVAYLVASRDGVYRTETVRLSLRGVVELRGPAADPGLVPEFEGITEAETIDDWEPPFPIDLKLVTDRDEAYWDRYRATPKAFVSLKVTRLMWNGGRPGADAAWITSMNLFPPAGTDLAGLEKSFGRALKTHLSPAAAGLAFRPVRRQALEASKGTQDFGVLFVSMSIFLVLAAMGLAGMLMRLSTQRRAAEAGTLLACGFTKRAAMRSVTAEGAALTVLGVVAGAPLGIAYARGIIFLLGTSWFGSIGDASLWLHVGAGGLATGAACGLLAGMAAVWWGTRRLARCEVLELLAGWQAMNAMPPTGKRRTVRALLVASLAAAVALGAVVGGTGAFFGSGAALLIAGLCACYLLLAWVLRMRRQPLTMATLTMRSSAANRGRSMLAFGLLACASFVIVATAANTRDYSRTDVTQRDSGAGGFSLRAVASVPVPYDFGTRTGREKLGFAPEDEALFEGIAVFSFLMNSGDDISCLNLAKPMFPRVIGVSRRMVERGGFRVTTADETGDRPWKALNLQADGGAIPVFGDVDSIRWQLHSGLGKAIEMPIPAGGKAGLRVAGKIRGSIFAGELLMSEANFTKTFPDDAAPRYFLIETPPGAEGNVADALRRNLGDMGMEVRTTREILNAVIGVQNTYIATFVALGGLGVVLGTLGLVIVLLRSALERRGEFALMLATGFGRRFPTALLIVENVGLLCAGLLCGAVSALVAVAPQIVSSESNVNWRMLAALLACIGVAGVVSCIVAARAAMRGSLLEALREE
jgi:putative ABC transport system permease protein